MAVPPPGDPGGGSKTASAGDNPIYIRVPDNEHWTLYSIAARDQTTVVRVNVWAGWGNDKALLHTGTQSSTSDYVFFNHQGLPLEPGQVLTIDFIACVLNDVLEWSYFIDRRRV